MSAGAAGEQGGAGQGAQGGAGGQQGGAPQSGAGALGAAGAGDQKPAEGQSGAGALGAQGGEQKPNDGPKTPEWAAKLSPELQNLVTKKGWQTQESLIESYSNLESKLGAGPNELLRIPKEGDEAGWSDFWTKLGRPGKVDDYKTEVKFEEGQPNVLDWFRQAAFKEGLSQAAFDRMAKGFTEAQASLETQLEGEFSAKAAKDLSTLKSEWGNAWESNLTLARAGAQALGLDQKVLNAIERTAGTEFMMKTMLKVGLSTSDTPGGSHGSAQSSGVMTAAEARAEIAKVNADVNEMMVWNDASHPRYGEVKQKMDRLFKIAYPGKANG